MKYVIDPNHSDLTVRYESSLGEIETIAVQREASQSIAEQITRAMLRHQYGDASDTMYTDDLAQQVSDSGTEITTFEFTNAIASLSPFDVEPYRAELTSTGAWLDQPVAAYVAPPNAFHSFDQNLESRFGEFTGMMDANASLFTSDFPDGYLINADPGGGYTVQEFATLDDDTRARFTVAQTPLSWDGAIRSVGRSLGWDATQTEQFSQRIEQPQQAMSVVYEAAPLREFGAAVRNPNYGRDFDPNTTSLSQRHEPVFTQTGFAIQTEASAYAIYEIDVDGNATDLTPAGVALSWSDATIKLGEWMDWSAATTTQFSQAAFEPHETGSTLFAEEALADWAKGLRTADHLRLAEPSMPSDRSAAHESAEIDIDADLARDQIPTSHRSLIAESVLEPEDVMSIPAVFERDEFGFDFHSDSTDEPDFDLSLG
jgi:opacity protein-like surface antigen